MALRTAPLVVALAIGGDAMRAFAADDAQVTIGQIVERWHARQTAIRSGVMAWRTTKTIRRGSVISMLHFGRPNDTEQPSEDVTVTIDERIEFQADKLRYEANGPVWFVDENRFADQDCVWTDDGTTKKHLNSWEPGAPPRGYIMRHVAGAPRPEVALVQCRPMWRFLRPLDPHFGGLQVSGLQIIAHEDTELARGAIVVGHKDDPATAKYFLDPSREFSMVQEIVQRGNGGKYAESAVEEWKRTSAGWLPARWRAVVFGENEIETQVFDAVLTEWRINEPLSSDRFDIRFPEGTLLTTDRGPVATVAPSGVIVPRTPERSFLQHLWFRSAAWASALLALVVFVLLLYRRFRPAVR